MRAGAGFGLGVAFGVVFADGGFSGALEHVVEEAEEAELEIRLVDILVRGYGFLAVVALYKAFELLLGCVLLQIGKDHLHLLSTFCLILTSEGGVAVAFQVGIVDDHGFSPNLDILVSGVVDLDMEIVGSAAHRALLIQRSQLLQEEAAEGRVLFGIKHLVLILDAVADLGEVGPLVLEAVGPALGVLVQTALADLWVVGEVALDVVDLLVADVLLLDVAEDVVVELGVEAEEHLGVVEVAALPHLLVHGLEQPLVHPHLVHLQLQVRQDLQHEPQFTFQALQHLAATVLHDQSHSVLVLGGMHFEEFLKSVALLRRGEGSRCDLLYGAGYFLFGVGVDHADALHDLLDAKGSLQSR
jgi:hypothetical protein